MPTYDYRCRACGHTFETVHSILDDGPTTCERCGGELARVLHPTGVIFKGSGFYATDSRKTPASDGPSSPTASTGSKSSGDAKTAADATGSSPPSDPKPASGSDSSGSE